MKKIAFSLAALTAVVTVSSASALPLFEDGLDNTSAFTITPTVAGTNVSAQIVNYGTGFSVPNPLGAVVRTHIEAPRTVAGSGATTGLMMTANDVGFLGGTGVAAGISAVSTATFSGAYQYSFDMYLSISDGVTEPFPEAGSTEQGTAAVGQTNTTSTGGWSGRATSSGVNTWITNENGFGSADAGLWNDGVEIFRRGDNRTSVESPFTPAYNENLWNTAFVNGTNFGVNQTPANHWVEVDIAVVPQDANTSSVGVHYNGVLMMFAIVPNADVNGAIAFGYTDPFSSINDQPDFMYGLFDNITVSDTVTVPEPASMALLALGGVAMLRRR